MMDFETWFAEHEGIVIYPDKDDIETVWNAAVAAEREACAKIAENLYIDDGFDRRWNKACEYIAADIRARGA